jgi:hypothetical protein
LSRFLPDFSGFLHLGNGFTLEIQAQTAGRAPATPRSAASKAQPAERFGKRSIRSR